MRRRRRRRSSSSPSSLLPVLPIVAVVEDWPISWSGCYERHGVTQPRWVAGPTRGRTSPVGL
eukprot:7535813-Pyramimonas_sp.AAC.1